MPRRMGGVDLLGEPEDVDDRAPSDVGAADNDSEIDVVGADVVNAVADVDVEGVADYDKHHAVTNEELHRWSESFKKTKMGVEAPWKDCRNKFRALPSDLHLHRDHQKIAQTYKECPDRTPHH